MSGVSWVVSVICCFLCIARFSEQHEIFRLGQLFQEHVDLDITSFNIFQGNGVSTAVELKYKYKT